MIEVCAPLEVKADRDGGWELTFYVSGGWDYSTPFRAMLAEIAVALGQDPNSDLELPVYEEYEDFIEGTLQFGLVPLGIYFEHSLSFLALRSENEAIVRDAANRIQSRVALV